MCVCVCEKTRKLEIVFYDKFISLILPHQIDFKFEMISYNKRNKFIIEHNF